MPTYSASWGSRSNYLQFLTNSQVANLEAAIANKKVNNSDGTIRNTCNFINALKKIANVMHRSTINEENWVELRKQIDEAADFLASELTLYNAATFMCTTLSNFKAIIDELLLVFPDSSIVANRANQDHLEKFFYNIALGTKMRTRTSIELMQLVSCLKEVQLESYTQARRRLSNNR